MDVYLLQYNFIRESKIDQKAIIPIYKEAIPNPYADIESQFETIKTSAQQSIYKLEDIITLYKNIIREPDPWNAIEVFDDLDSVSLWMLVVDVFEVLDSVGISLYFSH